MPNIENMKLIDFLAPGPEQIRKSIRDIDDSYNNDWDILAELLQNSVDAIRALNPEDPSINIEVNSLDKSITVKDNGIGISPNLLAGLLRPFSTNKDNDTGSIGEKGVGLTFVLFSCDRFEINSDDGSNAKKGVITDAASWKKSNSPDFKLTSTFTDVDSGSQGTKITLTQVEDSPIFRLSNRQLKYVLRTKTIIGNTNFIWNDEDININVNLTHVDPNNDEHTDSLENKFWMVYDEVRDNTKINLDDFISYATTANKTDADKRLKLKNKVIYKKGVKEYLGRQIKYVSCFVPKRMDWDKLSVNKGLCSEANLDDNDWLDEFAYSKFTSGIYTSVKGMPTGISITPPSTGYAGYWSNIFIIFEDSELKFDIGRKSIHGMTSRRFQGFAKEIFNEYLQYITKYVTGDVVINTLWDREETFHEINNMMDLGSDNTTFIKTPRDQEASVAGIFFECIGNGIISNLKPLTSGYRNRYDLYAKWGNKNLVIEFKSHLKNILKDFNEEQKLFDEINMIVCWDVSEDDRVRFHQKGIDIIKIEERNELAGNMTNPPHSTHILSLSGLTNPVYVMDLKQVLEEYNPPS